MKRLVACIIICMLAIQGIYIAAEAAQASSVQWHGDYTDSQHPKIVVTVKSEVPYNQFVTVTMYKDGISSPGFSDFCRIEEMPVNGGGTQDIVIPIGNDLDNQTVDGRHYKIKVHGSGISAAALDDVFDTYVLTPDDICGKDGIISKINDAASVETVRNEFDKLLNPLQIDKSDVVDSRLAYFISIKADDYDNNFESVADISNAWNITELIQYLKSDEATADGLKALSEQYNDALEIDINDADYIAFSEEVYKNICMVKNTYDYNSANPGINSCKAFQQAVNRYVALSAVNALKEVEADGKTESVFEKYYQTLGIKEEYMKKLRNMDKENSDKVFRVMCATNFKKPNEITVRLEETIDEILNSVKKNDERTSNPKSGGGGAAYSIHKDTDVQNTDKASFGDCDSSFWAYPYINELREKNIINGYQDGNFYPNNSVTREEFVKMALLSVGLYDAASECEFKDVPKDAWCFSFVASAVKEGIIKGVSDEYFGIGENITREDMAVIGARIISRFNNISAVSAKEYTDAEEISEYAAESINILSSMQILDGFGDGSICPKDNLTRAQAAKIIYMIMKAV